MWIARIILVIIYIKWVCGSSTNRTLINRSLMTPPEPKLSICCQSGSFMTPSLDWRCSSNSSKPIHDPEIPPIFTQDLKPSTKKLDDFEKIYGIPCVSELYELLWDDSSGPETYYLLDNGEILITETTDNSSVAHVKNYCFASWMGENGTYTKVFACFSQWIDPVYMIFNIILILPIPFLAATFIVYALLPELRNTHGLILMGYISALFWSKLGSSLDLLFISGSSRHSPGSTSCASISGRFSDDHLHYNAVTMVKNGGNSSFTHSTHGDIHHS
ncbi:uncharacterized protein LOC135160479 isoform X2 [Diachasmimorpha longicaudata]|uniref:uncharacterized protein LOC135160479 isoform X2 n=1 Tax=Diachasmimorpha longicaudata TaxID=58733 RepID=UPI0030B8C8DD